MNDTKITGADVSIHYAVSALVESRPSDKLDGPPTIDVLVCCWLPARDSGLLIAVDATKVTCKSCREFIVAEWAAFDSTLEEKLERDAAWSEKCRQELAGRIASGVGPTTAR